MGAPAAVQAPPGEPQAHAGLEIPAEHRARFRRQMIGHLNADADTLDNITVAGSWADREGYKPDVCREALATLNTTAGILDQVGWEFPPAEEALTIHAPREILAHILNEAALCTTEIAAGETDELAYAQWLTVACEQYPVVA